MAKVKRVTLSSVIDDINAHIDAAPIVKKIALTEQAFGVFLTRYPKRLRDEYLKLGQADYNGYTIVRAKR